MLCNVEYNNWKSGSCVAVAPKTRVVLTSGSHKGDRPGPAVRWDLTQLMSLLRNVDSSSIRPAMCY